MTWYLRALQKYATFKGRANRREYWMFMLVHVLILLVIAAFDALISTGGILSVIYSVFILIPGSALTFRRLHDSGKSGWWLLVAFIPFLGSVIIFIFLTLKTQGGQNKFGPNPNLYME